MYEYYVTLGEYQVGIAVSVYKSTHASEAFGYAVSQMAQGAELVAITRRHVSNQERDKIIFGWDSRVGEAAEKVVVPLGVK